MTTNFVNHSIKTIRIAIPKYYLICTEIKLTVVVVLTLAFIFYPWTQNVLLTPTLHMMFMVS